MLLSSTNSAHSEGLLVCRSQRGVPVAVTVTCEVDLPWLAANGAILNVRLPAPAVILNVQLDRFAAVGAHHRDDVGHVGGIVDGVTSRASKARGGSVHCARAGADSLARCDPVSPAGDREAG